MEGHQSDVPLIVWEESKKLWQVVGPAVFMRLALYTMGVISQAFVGHLGDRELAAFSIANTVVSGLSFGFLDALMAHPPAFAVLLAPTFIFSAQLLVALGQTAELSLEAGLVSMYMLPQHFTTAILLPLNKFLQSQLKNWVTAAAAAIGFPVHVAATWLLVRYFQLGVVGAAMAINISWALITGLLLAYALGGGCPETWKGPLYVSILAPLLFSALAFVDLKDFVKLSAASGVMLCLENWYYRVLIFLTGYMKNAELAVDALSICMSLAGWELMIHMGFLAGTGVRVANELGASNGKGARFATIVSTTTSFIISLFISFLALILHDKLAIMFTTSEAVIQAVDSLSVLLALTILLNGIQPVLSGVAVGSGWQALVAYVNIGSYYLIGVPFGVLLAWGFHYGVLGMWVGMISGTAVQTLILAYITLRRDWNAEALKASSRMQRWSISK
ncbi:hypothetical protein PVAP13_2NG364800 [Panicum virgatum]|uniref:Protein DETOXIFICATION n=1 Tax=Panicum virgatum TaxID=38727 RepID=A0A8T0VL16_PANVG|nr:hypothetical protein PVAP13_2NG364800 [Panicum virgatum]